MSQNLVKKIRLVQNSHKFLSKSLGCGKETLQREAGIELLNCREESSFLIHFKVLDRGLSAQIGPVRIRRINLTFVQL